MKTNYSLDLTDEQRQVISGKKAPATRKQVKAWLDALVARELGGSVTTTQSDVTATPNDERTNFDVDIDINAAYAQAIGAPITFSPLWFCGFDHLYPVDCRCVPKTGTPCYCGKREWPGRARKKAA